MIACLQRLNQRRHDIGIFAANEKRGFKPFDGLTANAKLMLAGPTCQLTRNRFKLKLANKM
jgi:hypothetical protein